MDLKNRFVMIFLSFLVLSILVRLALDFLNYFHRKKMLGVVPDDLKEKIDREQLIRIDQYSNEKFLYSTITMLTDKLLLLVFLFTGFYPWLYQALQQITGNIYLLCFLFFAVIGLIDTAAGIPFSLYFDFVIEKKYGFNKMSFRLWLADLGKGLLISALMGIVVLSILIFFLIKFPAFWWILIWGFMILFSLLMQFVYPQWIAPLFNRFQPLSNEELKRQIEELLKKTGYRSNGVFEMDASKRSGHSNAYFTGIGKAKRIVLYDTLLNQMQPREIVAVLGHEIGHFKMKHILKGMIISSLKTLFLLFLASSLIQIPALYRGFGFSVIDNNFQELLFIGLFLLSIISSPVLYFLSPLSAFLSRKHEFEADRFSARCTGDPQALIDALIQLNVKNLSNLYPAAAYVWFYYSHPTLLDRITALKKVSLSLR